MKNKYIIIYLIAFGLSFSTISCNGFLDQDPDTILTNDQVYSDPNLIKSVLANFYGRISWGQHVAADGDYKRLDEAVGFDTDNINNFDRNWWRIDDYGLVRNINQFLEGLENTTVLTEQEKKPLIGEARLIRAWYYFCSARSLGGMPIVGDEVYEYIPNMDITKLQEPRATEAGMYDYIINECNTIADMMDTDMTKNAARANKWTAKMLEARAALYAASLAKYNADYPLLQTPGKSVGIESAKANEYYQKALTAAKYVIDNSPYELQDKKDDKARNFYEAVTIKDGNTEVIWARDYKVPDQKHDFTKNCIPTVLRQEASSANLSVLLNLAEEYELIETTTPGQGSKFDVGSIDNPVFYNSADELFKKRDPRLGGTVIYPGGFFNGVEIVLQAGQLIKNNGVWEKKSSNYGDMGKTDENGILITSQNGPLRTGDRLINKTGFTIRKYLDETPAATTFAGSDVWSPRFRIAEAYMIACEASFELGDIPNAIAYINPVRERAGVKPLTTITFDNIVHERRVEFAFEDHRFWDMKRWRLADKVWNSTAPTAQRRGLFPYLVVAPGDPNNGKWVFEEVNMNFLYPNPLNFEQRHYYAEVDNDWLGKNPKLEKNPYQ